MLLFYAYLTNIKNKNTAVQRYKTVETAAFLYCEQDDKPDYVVGWPSI